MFIDDAGTLPLYRAAMAESVPGVASAQPLFLSSARLRNPGTGEEEKILAIGVDRERHFFMAVNPIGVMFSSGAVIAFLVGAVILYQILASEVMHHLREYATLKAMGYTGRDLKVVVMAHGLLMTAAGFIPSAAIAVYLYKLVREIVQVPLFMTPDLLGFIFSASLAMTAVSGLLVVRRIETADPAELF